MPKPRTVAVLTALAALAALAGVVAIMWAPQPEVSLTTLMRLTPGMSEADVAAVLGPPAADVTANAPIWVSRQTPGCRLLEYVGERATVWVEFDADGRFVRSFPMVRTVTGPERIRLRLNWW